MRSIELWRFGLMMELVLHRALRKIYLQWVWS
jgi:hypothetical protein